MKQPLYTATEDGNILNKKSGATIELEAFEIEKGHRGETLVITKKGGGVKRILRWNVDETKYSFGPRLGKAEPAPRPGEAVGKGKLPTLTVTDSRMITMNMSRESAALLLNQLRRIENLLMDSLISETMGS